MTIAMYAGYPVLAPFPRRQHGGTVRGGIARRAIGCLLKRPKLGFGSHPACYAGFETEQMVLDRLTGPHVPHCHAQGEDELGSLSGHRAHRRYRARGARRSGARCRAAEVARLGILLADALHDLHRQNVVHHDLTPAHVLIHADRGRSADRFRPGLPWRPARSGRGGKARARWAPRPSSPRNR